MNIMIAYDNSRNARKALDATLEMFGPLKPLIMLIGVVEETRDTSDSAVELYERERREFQAFLQEAAAKVSAFGLDVDVILAPATPCVAPGIGQETFMLDGVEMPVRPNIGIFTQPISFIGLPVVAVPVPLKPLPIGVQIIAAPWKEDVALRVAQYLEDMGAVVAPRPPLN